MKRYLLLIVINICFVSYSQNKSQSPLDQIRSLGIEFIDFSKTEYSKVKEISHKSDNKRVGEVIEKLEEETEAEVEGSFLRKKALETLDNVNVINFIRNQYRWYLVNSKNDPELAVDLISQHIITHILEVFGGPWLTSLYLLNGGDPILGSIMGAMSVVVAIPGLDPLCIIGFAAYRYLPIYRKSFRALRMTLFMLPKFIGKKLGVREQMAWLFGKKDRRDFIRESLRSNELTLLKKAFTSENKNQFHFSSKLSGNNQANIKMIFEYDDSFKGLKLKKLKLDGDVKQLKKFEISRLSSDIKKIYGWNVAQALKQSLSRLSREDLFGIPSTEILKSTYYIEDIKTNSEQTVISFYSSSVRSSGKPLWKESIGNFCNKLLTKITSPGQTNR